MTLGNVLLRDEFGGTIVAGNVNNSVSDSGHTRKVVDANNKVSIGGGELIIAATATGTGGDPQLWEPAIVRQPGLVAVMKVRRSAEVSGIFYFGFSSNNTTWHASASFFHVGTAGSISVREPDIYIGNYSTLSGRKFAIALRAQGAQYFVENAGNFLLVFVGNTYSGANNYLSANNTSAADNGYVDYWRIASSFLAPPLVSHGFDSAVSPSDGNGHAETSGLGSGGSGVAMSGTTWSVSGGKGINTPIGGEQLVDGGLEGAYTAGLHTSFTKAGSPTVAQSSDSHSGTKAQSFASTTGSDMIDTSPADTVGQWKRVSVWAKQSSIGAGRVNLAKSDGANFMLVGTISSGSYTKYVRTYRAIASGNNYIRVYAPAGGSDTVIVDDLSLQTLNLSDLLSLHPSSTPDVFAGIDITVIAGTQVGLALNWDSSSNPQNGVLVYFDGTNCKIDKCVAGVWTNVLSSAATVSRLIVGKIASSYRVYTPTALIGSVTIADAGIVNNTLHGLFSTYEGNTVDNWTVYASGSSGEYATAFDIVLNSSATERSGDYAAMSTVMELPSGVIEHGSDNDHGLLGTGLRSVIEATVYGPSSLN